VDGEKILGQHDPTNTTGFKLPDFGVELEEQSKVSPPPPTCSAIVGAAQ